MRSVYFAGCLLTLVVFSSAAFAQVEDIREATGLPFAIDQGVVYGQVVLEGVPPGTKLPVIYVSLVGGRASMNRTVANKKGYYFFRENPREGSTIIVEIDGVEYARQQVLPGGSRQQRYDFDIALKPPAAPAKPGTVSAKYAYERSKENEKLLDKAAAAVENRDTDKAISYLERILEDDPKDFTTWTLLGSVYINASRLSDAEAAYHKALELKPDLAHTMVNLGKLYLAQDKVENAADILKKATTVDPGNAVAFRLLGESYLRVKKGSLAIPALNEALRLAPVEMADSHLLLAWLYDAVAEKKLAAAEYSAFLKKVPSHPDRAKFEKYVNDNPE